MDSDDDDGEAKESDGEEVEKLKADAVNKTTSVDLEHIENSSDKVINVFTTLKQKHGSDLIYIYLK